MYLSALLVDTRRHSKIVEEEELNLQMSATEAFVATLAELVLAQAGTFSFTRVYSDSSINQLTFIATEMLGGDLEAFARYAAALLGVLAH
jgi:hypothetical protein